MWKDGSQPKMLLAYQFQDQKVKGRGQCIVLFYLLRDIDARPASDS